VLKGKLSELKKCIKDLIIIIIITLKGESFFIAGHGHWLLQEILWY